METVKVLKKCEMTFKLLNICMQIQNIMNNKYIIIYNNNKNENFFYGVVNKYAC